MVHSILAWCSTFLVLVFSGTYLCRAKELVLHKNHICCHNYCHKSLPLSKMAAEKLCTEQNPRMWELAQVPHCPFCHSINETKGQHRQLAKIWLPKVINKMFNGMSFSNENVLIVHKKTINLIYSESVYSSSNFLDTCD